jgi:hypothetical protein
MDAAEGNMRGIWTLRSFRFPSGESRLSQENLQLLHKAALAACDLDDGVKDGIVGNPLACHFDPRRLLCATGVPSEGCLTAPELEAAEQLYAGPHNSKGESLSTLGLLAGSELQWSEVYGKYAPEMLAFADTFFQDMVYAAGPNWNARNFDFDRDYKRLGLGHLYNNTNPDLRRFNAAGGKLLVYQGGTDVVENPYAIADYYQTVEKVMGGRQPTQAFFRLFIIPGMNHCGGGNGAHTIDYLSYLEQWVEEQKPPDKMIGVRVNDDYLASLPLPEDLQTPQAARQTREMRIGRATWLLRLPLDPTIPIAFTRAMYPYPQYAKYVRGDPNQAASFRPALPESYKH